MELNRDDGSLPRRRALALIELEPVEGTPGVAETLRRLCVAVSHDLHLAGATVTLVPEVGSHAVTAASGPAARRAEEMQFDAGEGPTRLAYLTGEPVMVANLAEAVARWPGFAPAAAEAGMTSLAALPLQVGAAPLGAMTLYWGPATTGPSFQDLRRALVFADLAAELLIDSAYPPSDDDLDPGLHSALQTHGHIYQAQGMVMVDLDVGLAEALARMRAHAFATGEDLSTVASRIVSGERVLSRGPVR